MTSFFEESSLRFERYTKGEWGGGRIKATTNLSSPLLLLFLAITEQLENCPIRSQRKTISDSSVGLKSAFPASLLDCTNFRMLNGRLLAEESQLKQKKHLPCRLQNFLSAADSRLSPLQSQEMVIMLWEDNYSANTFV